jgi:hypothetical protein
LKTTTTTHKNPFFFFFVFFFVFFCVVLLCVFCIFEDKKESEKVLTFSPHAELCHRQTTKSSSSAWGRTQKSRGKVVKACVLGPKTVVVVYVVVFLGARVSGARPKSSFASKSSSSKSLRTKISKL